MNTCDNCQTLVESVGRSKNRWLCVSCLADLVRQAEALVAQSTNLVELVENENVNLRNEIKAKDDLIETLINYSENAELELQEYRENEEETELAN